MPSIFEEFNVSLKGVFKKNKKYIQLFCHSVLEYYGDLTVEKKSNANVCT